MPLIEELPPPLRAGPRAERLAHAQVAAATDITAEGRFGREWLVVTEHLVSVLCEKEDAPPRLEVPLAAVTDAEVETLVGCGVLMARIGSQRRELIRFSNAHLEKFTQVAAFLRAHQARRRDPACPPPTITPTDTNGRRCARCDRQLPDEHAPCPACSQHRRVVGRLLRYLGPYRLRTALALLLTVLALGLNLLTPYLSKPLMNQALVAPQLPTAVRMHHLLVISLLMVGAGVLSQVVAILRSRLVVQLGMSVSHDLRTAVYRHLHTLSLRYFDRRQGGQILSRVTHDAQALESLLTDGIQYFLVNILTLVAIVAILVAMNWRLTLLILMPVPLVFLISAVFWPRMIALWRRFNTVRGRLMASVTDVLAGVRVVKAFAQEQVEIDRFRGLSAATRDADQAAEQLWSTVFPLLSWVGSMGALLVGYVGGGEVITGRIDLGTLMAFTAYLGFFYGPLQFLSRVTDFMARSVAAAARLFEVLDTVPEVREAAMPASVGRFRGEVEFDHVTFGYDRTRPVMREVSFQVRPGEMIGLVGHSGAGKSTLINLLCRFYDVDRGAIRIDGIDVRHLRQQELRAQIGVVLQETYLFHGTIAENIAYARPDAPREDIIAAAMAANAHGFIMATADGYDTLLGERGVGLSGGERQRLAIARAILHNPRILILDEATASVDTETEHLIQQAIQRLVRGRTTFAIAHRLSTLRDADRLLVLKDGRIAEIGTHAELLASGGEFARLVALQRDLSRIMEIG